MTNISEIHGPGIPVDEFADRGAMVQPSGYVPYLSLTKGEMWLWLAAQRAKILAQYYGGDAPEYRQAVTMIENALNAGLHSGNVNFVGAIPDQLQNIAAMIKRAQRSMAPASVAGIMARRGPRIGEIIPVQDRLKACMADAAKIKSAALRIQAEAKCQRIAKKEKIVNDNLVNMSPHMLYKDIPAGYAIPSAVETHRTLHRLGVEGISGVANITDYALVYAWVENGILEKNTKGGVGAIGSIQASVYLAPDPEGEWAKVQAYMSSKGKWINGPARIGIDPVTLGAIITVLTAAITAGFKFLTDIRKTEILAMSEARGFGTPEFSANKDQWLLGPGNQPTTAGGLDTTTLLLLAAGAYFLLSDDN